MIGIKWQTILFANFCCLFFFSLHIFLVSYFSFFPFGWMDSGMVGSVWIDRTDRRTGRWAALCFIVFMFNSIPTTFTYLHPYSSFSFGLQRHHNAYLPTTYFAIHFISIYIYHPSYYIIIYFVSIRLFCLALRLSRLAGIYIRLLPFFL